MKFDADLARSLLINLETGLQKYNDEISFGSESNYTDYYHIKKLWEHGFLVAQDDAVIDDEHDYITVTEITYAGHKFIESIRDDKIWEGVKQGGKKIGSLSLETAQEIASGLIRTQIKKWTGVEI